MTVKVIPVLPVALIQHWIKVEPWIGKAMPVNLRRYEAIDVLGFCIQGSGQAWFAVEDEELLAVIVTKIDNYARRRGLSMFAVGGEPHRMQEWFVEADKTITEYALKMGCDHVELSGRRGWEKVLGYEPRASFYVKDLRADTKRTTEDTPIEKKPIAPKNKNNGSKHHPQIAEKVEAVLPITDQGGAMH